MSTYNIIDKDNLSTSKAIAEITTKVGIDLLKNLKFDIGCVNHKKLRTLLILERLACTDYCTIDEEKREYLREIIISKGIIHLKELN